MPRSEWILNLALVAVVTIGLGLHTGSGWAFTPLLALFLWGYIGQADTSLTGRLKCWVGRSVVRGLLPLLAIFVAFLVVQALAEQLSLRPILIVLAYLLVPFGLAHVHLWLWPARKSLQLTVPLLLAILCLWLPIEVGLMPEVKLPPGNGVPVAYLLGLAGALYLFQVVIGLDGVGYTYRLGVRDWSLSVVHFSIFLAMIGVPLAVSLDFIRTSQDIAPLWSWPLRGLYIFFFIAVPEEILFRGILHNLLQRRLAGRLWSALILSSLVFGLAHSNNSNPPYAAVHLPLVGVVELPWVYILLATIAGVFYGLAYVRSGKLTTAALVHAMVDLWWSVFFHG